VSSRGNNRRKGGTEREKWNLDRLLADLKVVMMVMVMVMAVHNHDHLRLRRIGYREAEEKGDSEQSFLHSSV
jgi:hypothetical protein